MVSLPVGAVAAVNDDAQHRGFLSLEAPSARAEATFVDRGSPPE